MKDGQPVKIEDLGLALQEPTMRLAEAAKKGDMEEMQLAQEARMKEVLVFASSEANLGALISRLGEKPLESHTAIRGELTSQQ